MTEMYDAGAMYGFHSPTLPNWLRTYYESMLLETLRTKSILVPYCRVKEDFAAKETRQMVFTEVYDLEPNWDPTNESTIWKKGMSLDSRSVTISLEYYHDIIKYSDYVDTFTYLNGGDARGIIRNKLGIAMVQTLDILARNAHLAHPHKEFAGSKASREELTSDDLLTTEHCEAVRLSLEEDEIPGVATVGDGDGKTILCATTPRVLSNIRTNANDQWKDAQLYAGSNRLFTGEVGMWNGIRFVKTNRLRLRNCGMLKAQAQLSAATVPGQGSAAEVDGVYTPGQAGSIRYVQVDDVSDFAVGQYVTIHSQARGPALRETDGTQETRRIVAIDTENSRLSFDAPLLKAHDEGDFVTHGDDVHASIFWGAPGVVYGIAERPHVIVPPKIDDAMLINRVGWRGLLKFQLFKPEVFRVVESFAK